MAEKRQEALGTRTAMEIEPASNTLRKRILESQTLPISGPASYGVDWLRPVPHQPDDPYLTANTGSAIEIDELESDPLSLNLRQALEVAAANNRQYQTEKENVFRAALSLDLRRDEFRGTFAGLIEASATMDRTNVYTTGEVSGAEGTGLFEFSKRLKSGAELTSRIGIDLARMLEPQRAYSRSVFLDASISIPLLRGSGRHIVAEPLKQAERNVIYAFWEFERFKREFVVDVADGYLGVLQAADAVSNNEQNYMNLIASARRARALADKGRLSEIQVDQARQDELRARERWVRSVEGLDRSLDNFKTLLGLPTDARIELDRGDLQSQLSSAYQLVEQLAESETIASEDFAPADAPVDLIAPGAGATGPFEMDEESAVRVALDNRLDLRAGRERVVDAQRQVAVAADDLRAELTLLGSADVGERRSFRQATAEDLSKVDFDEGVYEGLITLDLPFERTAEAVEYRNSLIDLERAVRSAQELEDRVKLDIRNGLRSLLESRESLQIQARAVKLAEKRVRSTNMFLEYGQAEIRDLLESQEALVAAQNSLTGALVDYRIAELALQRDLGTLRVDENGQWRETIPGEAVEISRTGMNVGEES